MGPRAKNFNLDFTKKCQKVGLIIQTWPNVMKPHSNIYFIVMAVQRGEACIAMDKTPFVRPTQPTANLFQYLLFKLRQKLLGEA